MKTETNKRKFFDYKWVIVALSFLMVFICLGFCSSTKSLFIAPVTNALGIKRSFFSINDSCRFVTTAIINIFFGSLVARFGPKKLIGAGFFCLVASMLVYSVANSTVVFCVGGVLLGLGFSWTSTTMVGCVINKWCKENKGKIMGAVLAANGFGGAVAIQVVSPIIDSGVMGYRAAYRVIALIILAVAVLVMLFFKDSPKGDETSGHTVSKKKKRGQTWSGIPFEHATKKAYFYAAAVCIFLTGLVLQGINGVAAAHMRDSGLDTAFVAFVLSAHSISLTCCKFMVGFFYDKFGLRTSVNICSFTAVFVMIMLILISDSPEGKVFAFIYGIFSSLALPLETIMLPLYAGDFFGEKSFDKILGIFVSLNYAGFAIGSPMINICYDMTGSYRIGFVICTVIMAIVMLVLQFVIRAANKNREIVSEQQNT